MKFMPCKFHCPSFICFCKPSPHIYTPGPLKLGNAPHVPSTVISVPSESSDQSSAVVKNGNSDEKPKQQQADGSVCIKSSLKKVSQGVEEAQEKKKKKKKKVKWVDFFGKELVEIREFDSWWRRR
ncbi:hypothetical protein CDL15_Pgr025476 [Punica granatum]|uniref:Uncharacterized protein n=1 Tax=Punica granatum TaxID=22663 RepID=A0A218W9X1_PUNGR|nr:hypothetical protein CDL15_Pgr025476 [Punica granatum]